MSLLGVAYYLTPETLANTARSMAEGLPSGSRIVLDYLLQEEQCNPEHLEFRQKLLGFVERRGEPMRSEYSIGGLNQLMAAAGLSTVENFPVTDLEQSYRETFGKVPFEIPGLFGFGTFEV